MKRYKYIAYAYPTSDNAEHFGMSQTGCYFIGERVRIADNINTGIHPQADSEGFESVTDPDLQQLFREVDGTPCPDSLRWHPEYYTNE